MVKDLAGRDGWIVALGGGAVLREDNRLAASSRGKVVWLKATPETLSARIHADPTTAERRPNLTGQGGLAEIRDLVARADAALCRVRGSDGQRGKSIAR